MLKTALVALALVAAPPAFAASALTAADTDKDGTIDLAEAKAAAGALFDKLDADHEGTLDAKELKGRIAKKDMPVADPDKDEDLAYVETVFKSADKDNEGTVDKKELRSADGRKLERLLK